ncbi:response regulator [Noviherbaspirillum sp. Root189]|uniref:response regulator n=1 Tax=Noviherbaspirillum sp. Root189 TaxID=1736487 RepID=UPI002285F037|nr:response regulator [Noviherbaspirillum sp. Root189]
MLIEDHPANLELMAYLLHAFGHTCLCAPNGTAGLELALKESPDLVICDVHLPVLDGYGVIRKIRSDPHLQHLPVVAVTALAMVGDREKLLAAGFDGYISKPIEPETFVGTIEEFLPIPLPAPASWNGPHDEGLAKAQTEEQRATQAAEKNRSPDGDHIDR